MNLKTGDRKKIKLAALGKIPFDTVISNVKIINVFTGEILDGSVGISENIIAHVEYSNKSLEGSKTIDGNGKYLAPGFIDAHIHIESTMMTPANFTKTALIHGTTTVITDPHEIANVCGKDGVEFMLENSDNLPMRHFILAPSCVPSVPGLENAGAEFSVKEMEELLKHPRVIGVAEVMDFIGVINSSPRMEEILDMALDKDLFIQGHSPHVSGRMLSAYLCGGPISDHECRKGSEAAEKIRNGMYVDARESSISKNLQEIIPAVSGFKYLERLTLCTDDKEVQDILESGHMNEVTRQAVKYGLCPVDAIKCATLNTARELNIRNLGAVAPGYIADLVILDDLESFKVLKVFYEGEQTCENGTLLKDISVNTSKFDTLNTVNIPKLKIDDFKVKSPVKNGKCKVNIISYEMFNQAVTVLKEELIDVKDGFVDLSTRPDLKYAIMINRHGNGTISHAIVQNFGLEKGGVGSTISHDCHNLSIVYSEPETALAICSELLKTGGGIACGENGEITSVLPLEVAGLMTNTPPVELAQKALHTKAALKKLGLVKLDNPLLRIATLGLIVIPNVKMSDLGMVDVATQKFIQLFP